MKSDFLSDFIEIETKQVTQYHLVFAGKIKLFRIKILKIQDRMQAVCSRDGTGQDFLDPTGKFLNHRRLTGF